MKGDRATRVFSPLLKALILLLGVMGQYLALNGSKPASGAHFLYYTNISNILVSLLAFALLALELRALGAGKALALPRWLGKVRFALTVGILLTFVVFSLLLIPKMPLNYLASPSNLLLHNLVPLLASLDFILFSHNKGEGLTVWNGTALPLAYFVFVFGLMLSGVRFSGSAAPYYFLDFQKNGWFAIGGEKFGVFWWLLIITGLTLVFSKILLVLQKFVVRHTLNA